MDTKKIAVVVDNDGLSLSITSIFLSEELGFLTFSFAYPTVGWSFIKEQRVKGRNVDLLISNMICEN